MYHIYRTHDNPDIPSHDRGAKRLLLYLDNRQVCRGWTLLCLRTQILPPVEGRETSFCPPVRRSSSPIPFHGTRYGKAEQQDLELNLSV